jgi:hypothetical protein
LLLLEHTLLTPLHCKVLDTTASNAVTIWTHRIARDILSRGGLDSHAIKVGSFAYFAPSNGAFKLSSSTGTKLATPRVPFRLVANDCGGCGEFWLEVLNAASSHHIALWERGDCFTSRTFCALSNAL